MPPRTKNKTPNFEEATARLEQIVAQVNNPETGLEEMIALAAEGLALIRSSEQLLADAVQFQPTLYRLIANLATREEFTQMQTDQKMQIYQVLGRHTKDVENQLQRDGKAREKFSTDLSRKLSESLQDLDKAKENLERTCRKWVLIAAGVSAASSMLACILCLLLAG